MNVQVPIPTGRDYRPDIDGLRAIAVFMVIAFHAFPAYFRHGYIGVDVFFVISGYLITGILLKSRGAGLAHLVDFYGYRIRRIFPGLLVVLVSTGVVGYAVLLPAEFKALDLYLAASAGFASNLVSFLSSGYFEKSAQTTPLLHLWSLAIEEQFYIVWPLMLWWLGRKPGKRGPELALLTLLFLSFAFGLALTYGNLPLAYYHPLARAWELLAGAWLAFVRLPLSPLARSVSSDTIVVIALTVLAIGGIAIGNVGAFPGAWALLPVLSTVSLIAFAPRSWLGQQFLSHPLMVYIGRISYPLYLWHWVMLAYLRIEHPNPQWFWVVFAVGLSFVLAAATFHWVERPLQKRPLARVVPGLAGLMVAVLAFSWIDYNFNVVGKRQTALQMALEKEYDPRPAYRFRTCFLDSATQRPLEFGQECLQRGRAGEIRVLLWGDSLAAQLYPGLAVLNSVQPLAITQRTASSCPPSVSDNYPDRGYCDEINASTRRMLPDLAPDVVVINGRWGHDPEKLISELVRFLRAGGVRKILLMGPTPDWAPDLRGLLARTDFPGGRLPDFLEPPAATWSVTQSQTEQLRAIAKSMSIDFLAPVDLLCEKNTCRIKVSDHIPDGLIASDHDHFTAQGSEFLFKDVRAEAVVKP